MTTTTQTTTEYTDLPFTDYVDIGPALGQYEDEDEYAADVERLDDLYTDVCDGTPITIYARMPRQGEASGTYGVKTNGDLQILGYTIPLPDPVRDLMDKAWGRFCEGPQS